MLVIKPLRNKRLGIRAYFFFFNITVDFAGVFVFDSAAVYIVSHRERTFVYPLPRVNFSAFKQISSRNEYFDCCVNTVHKLEVYIIISDVFA